MGKHGAPKKPKALRAILMRQLARSNMDKKNDLNSFADYNKKADDETGASDVTIDCSELSPKMLLEVLPSEVGTVFAAILANIMTEVLTSSQENILGNFVTAVGASILFKASRDELDEK